jgi:cation diffusion facilitator CzcD-associated flavoprotein CzcO
MSEQLYESATTVADYGAIVVGAGFGGLRMLYELRRLGLSTLVIEEGSDVGGTWYWNRYPGARTDSEAWAYCFSFSDELAEEWNWSERYPAQPEVLSYLRHVAERFDLKRDIRFGIRVRSAVHDETTNKWVVTTDAGETLTATFFIPATGPLSKPVDPPFQGLADFDGDWFLTARWPSQEVDLSGKRVAVVGTGATGIQVVPVVAETAAEVIVFQRTPNYVIPGRNRWLTDGERRDIKDRYGEIWSLTQRQVSGFPIAEAERRFGDMTPDEQQGVLIDAWTAGGFQFLFGTFRDLMTSERANGAATDFIRSQIRAIVEDPVTADLLSPKDYPLGAKRPPLGHSYYEAFNRSNVTLVDVSNDPIERVLAGAIRTRVADYGCDVIIFATGFDGSTGALMAMDIRGRGGRILNDTWASGPRTFLGVAVDGFPNMFLVCGPQTPFGNIPVMIENEVRWIGRAIRHALDDGPPALEPKPDAVDEWVEEVDRCLNASLVRKGTLAHSWFLGFNVEGKPNVPLFYFGRANVYIDRLMEVAAGGFAELSAVLPPSGVLEATDAVTP